MSDMLEKCADMHKAAAEAKKTAIDLGAKSDKVDDEDDMETAGTWKVFSRVGISSFSAIG
jgi:hypothetical protein